MPTQNILVTGGSGLVGRALLKQLDELGVKNFVAPNSTQLNLESASETQRFIDEFRPNTIFHLAAKVGGIGRNSKNRASDFTANARINLNLVEAASQNGVRKIVAMGSGAVYPDVGPKTAMKEDQIWHGPPHISEAPYAHSKRLLLAHLEAAREEFGLDFAYCVSGNLYGPHDNFDPDTGHVIPSLIAKFHHAAKNGGVVSVWGSGEAVRDFTHSQDAAKALIGINANASGVLNLGSGQLHRIREIVDVLTAHTGCEVYWDKSKPDGQLSRYYDLSKLSEIGFVPEIEFRSGITQTYEWYSSNMREARGGK